VKLVQIILNIAAAAVVTIIAAMGLVKAVDLPSFGAAVKEWEIIPAL
jgi:hypothetical protein